MDLKNLLKSYFFLAKNRVRRGSLTSLFSPKTWYSFVLLKNVVFHNPWFYLSQTEVSEGEGLYFWGFWGSFFSLFLGPFFSSSCSQFFATYGSASVKLKIAGLHTLHLNMKNLIFCLKIELQTKPFKNTFFELIFHNLWFRLSQTEVFGGSEAKKAVKNMTFFVCIFFNLLGLFFLSLLVTNSWFFVTYGFASAKLRFSQVQPLVPWRPRGGQHRKKPFVKWKRGSRARVVCILEEELKGFFM